MTRFVSEESLLSFLGLINIMRLGAACAWLVVLTRGATDCSIEDKAQFSTPDKLAFELMQSCPSVIGNYMENCISATGNDWLVSGKEYLTPPCSACIKNIMDTSIIINGERVQVNAIVSMGGTIGGIDYSGDFYTAFLITCADNWGSIPSNTLTTTTTTSTSSPSTSGSSIVSRAAGTVVTLLACLMLML
jgi:hypothetical protein